MRVIKIQAVIGQSLPGVDPGTVSPVIVGLQAFPALQFDVRDHKIQLQPVLVPVLHPQTGILVAVQTGQQCLLKLLHQTHFLIVREVFFPERQHPGGVGAGKITTINQLPDTLRLTAQHHRFFPVSFFPQQVIHRATACTRTPAMNFDDHAVSPEAQITGDQDWSVPPEERPADRPG